MTRKHYLNVSIPEELAKEVDLIVKNSKLDYDSRAGFVIEAIREKIYKEKKL
jgi:metal-responsive CopG/Arc/MetJ family transcriptional regulator